MAIGTTMKRCREALRLTQAGLAHAAEVNVRQIRRYENDEQQPPLDIAGRVADALGITLDQLAGRTPPVSVDDVMTRLANVADIPVEPREAAWR